MLWAGHPASVPSAPPATLSRLRPRRPLGPGTRTARGSGRRSGGGEGLRARGCQGGRRAVAGPVPAEVMLAAPVRLAVHDGAAPTAAQEEGEDVRVRLWRVAGVALVGLDYRLRPRERLAVDQRLMAVFGDRPLRLRPAPA